MKIEKLKELSEAKCNCDIDWGHKPDCPVNILKTSYRKLDHFDALLAVAEAAKDICYQDECHDHLFETLKTLEEIE